ncbi:MAG: hypothetical protein QNL04_05495 [SAR324 cluster bacterium]|nr:hypothetical protein [SAR324 cluster bacterium]
MFRLLLFSFLLLTLQACQAVTQDDTNDTTPSLFASPIHTNSILGKPHGEGLFTPLASCSSSTCHGSNLKGNTVAPSCTTCHGKIWNTGGGTVSSSHTVNNDGIYHSTGLFTPETSCISCHGTDLTGGEVASTSCYSCHGERWNGEGSITSNHTDSEDGYLHDPNKESPVGNCDQCHGADLTGGNASSCYSCHGAEWLDSGDSGDDD